MIGKEIQHYRIVRQLGSGGMGIVYEAEDTRLGRHVALKFLPESQGLEPETVERFLREAKIASSLNHPNICTIYDIGSHEGRQFIAMELLDGESLRGRLHAQALPLDTLLDVGCQIADALDAAHAKASSTATSSLRTSSSPGAARRSCSTSASPNSAATDPRTLRRRPVWQPTP